MARPRKTGKQRWVRDGIDGYIEEVDGRAVSVYSGNRKHLGFAFHRDNRKTCLDFHAQRVTALKLKRLGVVSDAPVITTPKTVRALLERYKELRLSPSTAMRHVFYNAVRHYLLGCTVPVTDVEAMAVWLTKRDSGPRVPRRTFKNPTKEMPPLMDRTRRGYLVHIKSLFALAVDLGWISRNPVSLMQFPPAPSDGGHVAVPYDVAERIVVRAKEKDAVIGDILELILLTGLRIHEALEMRRQQIQPDHILVIGKGAAARVGESEDDHRRRKPRRIIPLVAFEVEEGNPFRQWQDRLQAVVLRITERHTRGLNDRLFWRPSRTGRPRLVNYNDVHRFFNSVLAELGLVEANYEVHGFRKTAEHYFENVLCLDPLDFCDMVGHSLATYLNSYRKRRNPNQMIGAFSRRAQMLDMVDDPAKLTQPVATAHPFSGPRNR